jgi:hypothetical protein
MTFKCNGCGGEYDEQWCSGLYAYGNATHSDSGAIAKEVVYAQHVRTLCIGCHMVLKAMLLNSDLSEHWENEKHKIPDTFMEQHDNSE